MVCKDSTTAIYRTDLRAYSHTPFIAFFDRAQGSLIRGSLGCKKPTCELSTGRFNCFTDTALESRAWSFAGIVCSFCNIVYGDMIEVRKLDDKGKRRFALSLLVVGVRGFVHAEFLHQLVLGEVGIFPQISYSTIIQMPSLLAYVLIYYASIQRMMLTKYNKRCIIFVDYIE